MRPQRLDLRPERLDLRPERLDLRPERLDMRPERLDLRPGRSDLRPERSDLRPERPNEGGGRTNGRTNERKSPVFYRTSSLSGPLPCFPSLQFTITQSRATGIADHLLPLGDLFGFLGSGPEGDRVL